MHCRRASGPDEPPRYVVGVQFIDDAGESGAIDDLIARIS
jgi:hypothetical protein